MDMMGVPDWAMLPDKELWAPSLSNLNQTFILGEMIERLEEFRTDFPKVDVSELKYHFMDYRGGSFKAPDFLRGVCLAFRNTSTYQHCLKELDSLTKSQVVGFLEGRTTEEDGDADEGSIPWPPSAKHRFKISELCKSLHDRIEVGMHLHQTHNEVPKIYDDTGRDPTLHIYRNTEFQNLSETIKNQPQLTFVPTTVASIERLVLYAKKNGYRIRCSGYRHSQVPTFSADKQILVSLLDLRHLTIGSTKLSDTEIEQSLAKNELKSIDLVKVPERMENGAAAKRKADTQQNDAAEYENNDQALVRVGAAVTIRELKNWLLVRKKWTMAADVNLMDVTIGGVVSTICHGAGHPHQSFSDRVRGIEYVDANGLLQAITDKDLLHAAAGSFGLIGIITHITLELDKMTFAVLKPVRQNICKAIPPTSRKNVPSALRASWVSNPEDGSEMQRDIKAFEDRALNSYYSEWVWSTYQQEVWVNTWSTTEDGEGAQPHPSPQSAWLQWISGWLSMVVSKTQFFNDIPVHWQVQMLATIRNVSLPTVDTTEIENSSMKTALPNALHLRQGTEMVLTSSMEFLIPIPPCEESPLKPDLSIARRAWWDAIDLVYSEPNSPLNVGIELRIIGDSNTLLSPQRGNSLGTVSIEVQALVQGCNKARWHEFCQKLANIWMSYEVGGKRLNTRPHWAKMWSGFDLCGIPASDWLRRFAYSMDIDEFREALATIGKEHGWTLEDTHARFSNQLWDSVIYHSEPVQKSAKLLPEYDFWKYMDALLQVWVGVPGERKRPVRSGASLKA